MKEGPKDISNPEKFAREIYHQKIREKLIEDPTLANRPLVHTPGSKVRVMIDSKWLSATIEEGQAGVYFVIVDHPSGATEPGSFFEDQLEKLN